MSKYLTLIKELFEKFENQLISLNELHTEISKAVDEIGQNRMKFLIYKMGTLPNIEDSNLY